MRIAIIAVGRLKPGPELALIEIYATRLKPAPARIGPLEIVEIDERKDERRIAEAMKEAVQQLPPGSRLIALDERGEDMTTKRFSEVLARWRDDGAPAVGFLIGGADGLGELRLSAQSLLSLGRMTWPHRLARAMLAEQIYRAASLLAGHPYHREG